MVSPILNIILDDNLIFLSLDFPLSAAVETRAGLAQNFPITPTHFQMAAQVPSQWLGSADRKSASTLAMKKVVYRSLISSELQTEAGTETRRLGRVNNTAYESFDSFLSYAGQKLGIDISDFSQNAVWAPIPSTRPLYPGV